MINKSNNAVWSTSGNREANTASFRSVESSSPLIEVLTVDKVREGSDVEDTCRLLRDTKASILP